MRFRQRHRHRVATGRVCFKRRVRTLGVTLITLASTLVIGFSGKTSLAVQLAATYALKGTQIPVLNITSDPAIQAMANAFGVGTVGAPPAVVAYPATLRPFSPGGFADPTWDQSVRQGVAALQSATCNPGCDPASVIFGYSQGAIVGSEYKKAFNANPTPGVVPKFVFVGNGDRPNGGILSRMAGLHIPGLDLTATGATPTETNGAAPGQNTTEDYAGQYDPIADAPTNPANLIALANAGVGTFFVHLDYDNPDGAVLQDEYGDTKYYLIPSYPVPLLMPVQMTPVVGPVAADTLDPLVRLVVEAGYNRTISPGQPTRFDFSYFPDPAAFAKSIPVAVETGLDNGLQDIGLNRPSQTDRPEIGAGTSGQGAYGIGGPPVTISPATNESPVTPAPAKEAPVNVNDSAPQVKTPSPPQPPAHHTFARSNQFNVLRQSLTATPGKPIAGAPNSSQPKHAEPARSALDGMTKSLKDIKRAIRDTKNSVKGDKKPGKHRAHAK